MKLFKWYQRLPHNLQVRHYPCRAKPRHLICFKQWTADMVLEIIRSAINLKCRVCDTHNKRMDVLAHSKVMILQEVNEPVLNMAVSKAATFLGADDVNIIDHLVWQNDYNGKIFSYMADAIFVATSTHMCVMRFAEQSLVPVMCMRSRTHASIQALSTVMAIIEEFGTMQNITMSWMGHPHPVLNSYLLLCPMLGANIRFKCCCSESTAVSPLLLKASEDMTAKTHTECKECTDLGHVLADTSVVVAGPTAHTKEEAIKFKITVQDIQNSTKCHWIFFHTCPKGPEVDNTLFNHCNARTFHSFHNMQFIAAALMANAIKGHQF